MSDFDVDYVSDRLDSEVRASPSLLKFIREQEQIELLRFKAKQQAKEKKARQERPKKRSSRDFGFGDASKRFKK